jgi:AcrR family transcriptional regulator
MNVHTKIQTKQNRSNETIEILMAAVRLQLREGEMLSMQAIADKAGVSIGTVYHHFRSKDQILGYAYALYLDKIASALEKGLSSGFELSQIVRDVFVQNIVDVAYYRNIIHFLIEKKVSCDSIWNEFSDRVCEVLLKGVPHDFDALPDEQARRMLRAKLNSVRAIWLLHMDLVDGMPIAHQEALVDSLVSLIREA